MSWLAAVLRSSPAVPMRHGPSLFAFSSKQLYMRTLYSRSSKTLRPSCIGPGRFARSVSNGGALRSVRTLWVPTSYCILCAIMLAMGPWFWSAVKICSLMQKYIATSFAISLVLFISRHSTVPPSRHLRTERFHINIRFTWTYESHMNK